MQIEISKEEYRSLIDIIQIAEWVMNAHKVEKDFSTEKYTAFEQKIYSFADKMECGDLVEYDETLKEYFPTRTFDEGPAMQYVEEYNNDTFWDELIDRLVDRDVIRKIGEKKFRNITLKERLEAEAPLRDKYGIEFEQNGIDNVGIKAFDGYMTEIKTIYGQLQAELGVKIEPAPDEWDRLYNVDFFIKIKEKYIGLQVKPVSAVSHIPQIYKERGLQEKTHKEFYKKFGGKVFYIFSYKDGNKKVIENKSEVIKVIREEIGRLDF